MVSMSLRDTLMRFEPVGGTPRMLVPVMMISSRVAASSDDGSASCGVGLVGWAKPGPADNSIAAASAVPARAICLTAFGCLLMVSSPVAALPLCFCRP